MLITEFSKRAIAARREERQMRTAGYERVGEGGGELWQLYRGARVGHIITDARIAADQISVWVKIEPANQK